MTEYNIKIRPRYEYREIEHQYNTCPGCKHKYIETGDKFCRNCGAKLNWTYTHAQASLDVDWQEDQGVNP